MSDEGGRSDGRQRAKADFRFDDARLCFAFAGTLADRGTDVRFERLARPEDLSRWAVQSGCTTVAPTCTETDLDHARRLREAVQRTGQALAAETPPDPEDIALINSAAAEPTSVPALSADATTVRWNGGGVAAVLSMVARDLIALCDSEHRTRVRICGNPACGTPFVDTSRAGARRWCSMKTCGALVKKRAYRARIQAADDGE
ncbi:ABATE domain-containing protein [Streptomyces sp. FH025]|uniref:CGNR zinc finger domain-containing protein n=1 Tax=Streptomyces sp. FH025 TaxID=2815937 RepID=UPI001A9E8126|nr:CGNR zinc finger domain-containing protein [Streptomyces sp. FH025]MBO1418158.1 CGNR zinc finger domain-containing protein [Streptomyces sp. FH025]